MFLPHNRCRRHRHGLSLNSRRPPKSFGEQPGIRAKQCAKAPAARRAKTGAASEATTDSAATAIDFAHDIRPLFERSCADCHGQEKQRGGFALTSRDLLLKGGASGGPAIASGNANQSALVHDVTGKIEDPKMPPLDRRKKYPGFTAAEIERLRVWIDAGAPWSTADAMPANPQPAVLEE